VNDDYIALVSEHLDITSEASLEVLRWQLDWRMANPDASSDEARRIMDAKRAEVWKKHLDAAGLTIGRIA